MKTKQSSEVICEEINVIATESKLLLFFEWQANKSRSVRVRNCAFIWKSSRRRIWQTTIYSKLEYRLQEYSKGRVRSWLLQTSWCCPNPRGDAIILCSCTCPTTSGQNVSVNPQQDKYYFSVLQLLSFSTWMKSIIPLQVRALRKCYYV